MGTKKPRAIGAYSGEVNANIHKALGCVGTILDGAIRDVDEMNNAGFKALARRMCVGHAHSWPVRWNCEIEVFGRKIKPGQLIHADKHGFLAIPDEDAPRVPRQARRGMNCWRAWSMPSPSLAALPRRSSSARASIERPSCYWTITLSL